MSVKLKHLMVLSRAFTAPSGNEGIKELEVYNFTGAGGIALSMYNTDEVCICIMFSFIILLRKNF